MRRPAATQQVTKETANNNFEKQAEHYSRMPDDDLIRLATELTDLTDTARAALLREISGRGLKESALYLALSNLNSSLLRNTETGKPRSWNYETMSDEELQRLCTAYQKLEQQVPDSLRDELAARASRRVEPVSVPSSAVSQITTTQQGATPAVKAVSPVNTESPPYANFVVQLLLACLAASVGVFALFDAFARNSSAFGVEVISGLFAIVFGWFGWRTYRIILNTDAKSEIRFKDRSRKALVTSLVFILLFLGMAALLGSVIGQNRAEAIQLISDINRQKELAKRITKARNSASDSIQSYIDMYARIEDDVNDYSSTLLKLRQEISLYDSKFPEQSGSMRSYSNTIDREIRRSDLLKKQIASAKEMSSLDGNQRVAAWRSDMLPILQEEDALDKSK